MHQHKTVAQILLILSILNLVLAAPVEREMCNTHGDVAVPFAVRNAEVIVPKERRQPTSDGADGLTPSGSSLPDELTSSHSPLPSSDISTPSHPLLPLPEGSSSLSAPVPPPDGEATLDHRPTPPDGPASLAVSPLPGETEVPPHVPATDHSVLPPESVSEIVEVPPEWPQRPDETEGLDVPETGRLLPLVTQAANQEEPWTLERTREARANFEDFMKKAAKGLAVIAIGGGLVAYFRHRSHHHRTIDLDCSTAKGSQHTCLDD